jgi:hypothetical protein
MGNSDLHVDVLQQQPCQGAIFGVSA